MLPERDQVFVAQMVEAAEAALEFTEGIDRTSFCEDRLVGSRGCGPFSWSVRQPGTYRKRPVRRLSAKTSRL